MRSGWVLTDYFEAMDGDQENPQRDIHSADDLRQELLRLASLESRIVELEMPDRRIIRIGIGGPWGGFGVIEGLPATPRVQIARAETPPALSRIEFMCWQQPSSLRTEQLFPAAEVVELVVGFYQTGSFPEWLRWDQS